MGLQAEISEYVRTTFREPWDVRDSRKAPDPSTLSRADNEAAKIDAVILHAKLAESTVLVRTKKPLFAAEVHKNYLHCATKIVTATGGAIVACGGDQVTAVFLGESRYAQGVRCALRINHAVKTVINPAIKMQYPESTYVVNHTIGVDASTLLVVNTGTDSKDNLTWVGNAANNAALMAALSGNHATYISKTVYDRMPDSSKFGGEPQRNMWTAIGPNELEISLYASDWTAKL